jgi:hypothetical protein
MRRFNLCADYFRSTSDNGHHQSQSAYLKRAISGLMNRSNSSLVRSPEVESFRGQLVSRLGAICRFEIGFQACSSPSRALASFKSSVSKPSVNQP